MDTKKKKRERERDQFNEFYKNWNAARMQKLRYWDSVERRPAGAVMFHVDRRLVTKLRV